MRSFLSSSGRASSGRAAVRSSGRRIGFLLSLTALVPMVTVPVLPVMAQAMEDKPSATLQLATGSGRLITMSAPIADVFTANPAIADVQVRSPTQLYIIAKGAGETSVFAVAKGGRVVYSTNVRVGDNFNSLAGMFHAAMPDADITATTMNGMVLLTGNVHSPEDIAEAERLAKAFVGDKVQVVSRLKTATPLQVNLQVKFAEVSRSFIKNMGLNALGQGSGTAGFFQSATSPGTISGNWCTATGCTAVPLGQLPSTPGSQMVGTTNTVTTAGDGISSTLGIAGRVLGMNMLAALQLGEQAGQVTTLASPNLTALSGETGSFLAGGEIPIPSPQPGSGGGVPTVTIEYKQYGVSLSYTPTVLSDGRISLRVRPEVSQLSSAGAVSVSGISIPALTTRRAETTVELGSGQSFMIAGLLQNDQNNTITKMPGAGDIPILGSLFRSNSFQRNETELVIIITPYLVKPVNANDIKLPTDNYRAPNDVERVLLGRVSGQNRTDRPKPTLVTPGMSALADPAAAPAPAAAPVAGDAPPDPSAGPAPAPAAPAPVAPDAQSTIPIPRADPSAPGFGNR